MTTSQAGPDGRTVAPPSWVQRPANLAQAVTAELVQRIVRGVHPPGTPLPPEPALCETFAVSRTVIREAVKVLQEKGLVQVRQGSGTVVTAPSKWNMLDELVLGASVAEDESLAILDDLVVTRRLLESDMANVAARLADEPTVERLRATVARMDELVDDHVAYEEQDRVFHDAIMEASGNRIARAVVKALVSQVLHTARYVGRTDRSLCIASNLGHRRIYERIAAGDPDGAAAAMFDHITDAWLVRRGGPSDAARLQR
ncbi:MULTISPECIES: FadR/GntR family transcriptional regulator [Dactylosporangium]|uniref:GntR family transcriptional regulator n=1 Tax=Dactylosporangium matsuzakiense TaxID=53360 RepID=A0A9W6KXW1_9ACTN|nr:MULTISPECIES: FCD domain-containing protein [Dactylosporangium]UAC00914.1 FadR family transcriptional regulator [Dactylosporangium vinaceum]UWZ48488.1 FadR family transcriptional regulator [Dactylosporangium matsuzakiense]GLL08719.1 GntR family transcriptional regulator [Dactylosporangium matsuzakiense]